MDHDSTDCNAEREILRNRPAPQFHLKISTKKIESLIGHWTLECTSYIPMMMQPNYFHFSPINDNLQHFYERPMHVACKINTNFQRNTNK